jgi:hypothetical protein
MKVNANILEMTVIVSIAKRITLNRERFYLLNYVKIAMRCKILETTTYELWKEKAKMFFGHYSNGHGPFLNFDDIKFKCVRCGHVQSVNSVMEHNPFLDREEVKKWIHCNCEGRTNKKYGCDWTLYGLFQHQNTVVIKKDGEEVRSFPLAEEKRKRHRTDCKYFYIEEDGFASCDRQGNDYLTCEELYCPLPKSKKKEIFGE